MESQNKPSVRIGNPCDIAIELENGAYLRNHVRFDGYPAGVGRILLDSYNNPERIGRLLALGNLDSLGPIPFNVSHAWIETFLGNRRRNEEDKAAHSRIRVFSNEMPYCEACDGGWCRYVGGLDASYRWTCGEPSETVGSYAALRRCFLASNSEYLYLFDREHGWRVMYDGILGVGRLIALRPAVERQERMIDRVRKGWQAD